MTTIYRIVFDCEIHWLCVQLRILSSHTVCTALGWQLIAV